jgi:DNA-binding transcriptional MerR regulator
MANLGDGLAQLNLVQEENMALEELRAELLDTDALKTLDERIREAYDQLVLNIGGIANLTEASVTQLRYWEKQELIGPQEAENGKNREYSLADLKKLMWITQVLFSESAIKPADIARIFREAPEFQDLLNAILAYRPPGPMVAMPIEKNLEAIVQDSFYQFLCPALAEVILVLLWKRLEPHTGFIIPIAREKEIPPSKGSDVNAALQSIGESVLGFADQDATVHFWMQDPIYFQKPDDYLLRRIEMASDVFQWPVYLVWRQEHTPPFDAALSEMDTDRAAVLARLFNLVLQLTEERKRVGFSSGKYLAHTTPTSLVLSYLGALADKIAGLGRRDKPWGFCCLLAPTNPGDPRHQHTLAIIAQSKTSPHSLGTILEPREGVSSFAYKTGQIVNVESAEQEPRIARREAEESTKSAMAVPISCGDDSDAVLYVASDHPQAFTQSDELMLTLLGHAVAAKPLLNALKRHQMCADRLRSIATIKHPYTMDPRFRCFKTNDQFVKTIEERVQGMLENASEKGFALLAVDVDKSNDIWDAHRDEALLKDAWQWVGKAAQHAIESDLKSQVELYRIHTDRYAAIIDTDADRRILDLARWLHRSLQLGPVHVSRSDWASPPVTFTTRLAIVLVRSEEVGTLPMTCREIRQSLLDRLHSVLRFGKREGGNLIAWWGPNGAERPDV